MPQNRDVWQETLKQLQLQMTKETFNTWLKDTRLIGVEGDVYTIEVKNSMAVDWLENRLIDTITRTLSNIVGSAAQVKFVAKDIPFLPLDELEENEPDKPDAKFTGAYYDQRNAIIQPTKVRQYTRYFEKKWRPKLGPLLSELVRELRQRCHFKTGRNEFTTTYKSLARAVGVNEKTIKRALARNDDGGFKNEDLSHFIKDMKRLKESYGKGRIRDIGTEFVIYLDEPLTPEDEIIMQELSEGTK